MDPRRAAFSPRRAAIRTGPETSRGGSTTSTPRASSAARPRWRARATCNTTRWPSREGRRRPSTYRTREGTDIRGARGARTPLFSCAFSRTVGFFARTARRDARLTSRFPRKAPSRASGTGPARRNARVSAVRARRRPAPARAREAGRHRVTRRVAEAPRRVRGRARTRSHAVFGTIPEVSRKAEVSRFEPSIAIDRTTP